MGCQHESVPGRESLRGLGNSVNDYEMSLRGIPYSKYAADWNELSESDRTLEKDFRKLSNSQQELYISLLQTVQLCDLRYWGFQFTSASCHVRMELADVTPPHQDIVQAKTIIRSIESNRTNREKSTHSSNQKYSIWTTFGSLPICVGLGTRSKETLCTMKRQCPTQRVVKRSCISVPQSAPGCVLRL